MKQSPLFIESLASLFADLSMMQNEVEQARAIAFCLDKLVDFAQEHARILGHERMTRQ